jgi:hypothetical protein
MRIFVALLSSRRTLREYFGHEIQFLYDLKKAFRGNEDEDPCTVIPAMDEATKCRQGHQYFLSLIQEVPQSECTAVIHRGSLYSLGLLRETGGDTINRCKIWGSRQQVRGTPPEGE